jgi:hypothetical protein
LYWTRVMVDAIPATMPYLEGCLDTRPGDRTTLMQIAASRVEDQRK